MNLTELTIIEAKKGLLQGNFSCVEYVNALIAQTEAKSNLNCYINWDVERLQASAVAFDKNKTNGLLAGIPIAIKDNMDVAQIPTTGGTGSLKDNVPTAHAPVVERVLTEGALMAGKANMHELALGITSNNSVFGACRNPYSPSLITGGSSGGCGALLAACMAPGAIGTDTGGSVRIPAALCGVVGFRPSAGRYLQSGIIPISHTRDTAGPMARTVADVALLDQAIVNKTPDTPHTSLKPESIRLGVLRVPSWNGLDEEVEAVAKKAVSKFAEAGVQLIDIEFSELESINAAIGLTIVFYEYLIDVPAYLKANDTKAALKKILMGVGSPDVAGIIQAIINNPVSETVYQQAMIQRQQLQQKYQQHFQQHQLDALIFPTTVLTARPIGEDVNVLIRGNQVPTFQTYLRNTDGASIAGLPSISIPAGLSSDGLPIGLLLDGAFMNDRHLLQVAATVEQILGSMAKP